MPYLSSIKRRAYARRWRRRNPRYMAEYGRAYYALGKKPHAKPDSHANAELKTASLNTSCILKLITQSA